MLTPEEQKAEDALDSSFKGSIAQIKKGMMEQDLNIIREVIGNITVWCGHLGDRPDWLTSFSRTVQEKIDQYGNSDQVDAKEKFFEELQKAYDSIILKKA
ncbi:MULTISPECIES: hypothetical protein [Flammeovirga]|uniref:Uncharacterized protein n=1 Tax=Flammeovirga agarivorans TaxID=2726742 RepID=A0A7X8XXW6_9BACT|nr:MULTISPECIES: hypothetical protein [Flammeovirga]NLR93646.1 hypothetical protein [Flammeovirga agarivorans]